MAAIRRPMGNGRNGGRRSAVPLAALALALTLAACGDDDDTAASSADTPADDAGAEAGAGDGDATPAADPDSVADGAEDYCEVSRQLNEQDGPPTPEQLQDLIDTAPDDIADDVRFVAERFLDAEDEAAMFALFGDPEIQERLEPIEAFDAEGCGIDSSVENPEGVTTEPDADAEQVEVIATEYDFAFDAPPPGAVSFVMSNEGDEHHFMGIGKLNQGVTLDEALQADDPSSVTELLAESDVAGPGEEAVLTFEDLEPGTYGMVCFIPAPDGEPHAFKGMAIEFEVG